MDGVDERANESNGSGQCVDGWCACMDRTAVLKTHTGIRLLAPGRIRLIYTNRGRTTRTTPFL
jgi:hypothetical protein